MTRKQYLLKRLSELRGDLSINRPIDIVLEQLLYELECYLSKPKKRKTGK